MSDQFPEQPRRRSYDRERQEWTDGRLDDLAAVVKTLQPLVPQVASHQTMLGEVVNDISSIDARIGKLEERLVAQFDAFRDEYRRDRDKDAKQRALEAERTAGERENKRGGRTAIVVAVIAAVATVLGSLAVAIASLLGGSP